MTCTCAGTAPGYPQHEPDCGKVEPDDTSYDGRHWEGAYLRGGVTHYKSIGGWFACDTAADFAGCDMTGVTCPECLKTAEPAETLAEDLMRARGALWEAS